MLVRPNDLETTFRYSQIEEKLGDYEAAIGALERMLFYNPNLPRVKLELGLCYFKLHSYETARSYFDAAIASPDTPQDVREQVAKFVAAIDRGVSDNQFAFYAQVGLRGQTNANAGPDSQLVRALGQNAVLSSQFKRTSDFNVFGLSTLHHFYDFNTQNGAGWETDVTAYYAKQFKVQRLDLGLIEIDTGPRLALWNTGITVHPYAIANDVTLGGQQYFNTLGAGFSARFQLPMGITVDPGVEYRRRDFSNSGNYPTADFQTGHQVTGYITGAGPLPVVAGLSWQARLAVSTDTATYRPYAYDDVSIDVAFPYAFAAPAFLQAGRDWVIAPFVGYSDTPYKQADIVVDPLVKRHDNQWRVGSTLDMTVYRNIGFAIQVQYLNTDSNISNFRTHDFVVSAGPTIRF